jgi:hypothetical protein
MTAYRVIDDHKELENVGTLTHGQIDGYINDTSFIIFSGSTEVPSGSRQLVAGTGITITDGGPGSTVVISSSGSSEYVYPNDLLVSLKDGKTFGRYSTGQTIPSTGKTPAQVIMMAIAEPIDPSLSITGFNVLTSAFNTTGSVTSGITSSYVINSSGGSVSSVALEFRSGNVGPWSTLTTSTATPLKYDHVFNVDPFFVSALNYRYVVSDDQGASGSVSLNLVPQSYATPTISLSLSRDFPGGVSGETNTKREIGNVSTSLTGLITRQRVNVPITSYSVQFSANNGSTWTDVPGLSSVSVSGNPSSVSIPSTQHFDLTLKNSSSIQYRATVVDSYQSTTSSVSTVNFLRTLFYGPAVTAPSSSVEVRSLPDIKFVDSSNPFNLETGNTERNFVVAIPSTLSVTEVIDLDALNANITANYVLSTFNVDDAGGTPVSYRVYTMTNAIPYTSNHRHRVTRG